jgi:shikimate dehydrogenase
LAHGAGGDYGLPWQFWKNDIANTDDLALAVQALRPLGYKGMAITVPWKVAVIPLLDGVDGDVEAIGAANYMTIENGRLIGHNNDGKGVVKAIEKVAPLKGQRVVMLGAGAAHLTFPGHSAPAGLTGIIPEESVFQRAVAEALGETPAG